MFSKFLNLEPEKQERIINAAMKEFAEKGFKNASTNEIVKEANIAKGMLFHYFSNKKTLFLFLYDYTLEVIGRDFFGKIDFNERDILKRLRQVALTKYALIGKYPGMFDFAKIANFEDSSEVKSDLESRNKEFINLSYVKIFEDIDTSKFRHDIDIKAAMDVIIWTIEGFAAREQEKLKQISLSEINYDELFDRRDTYLGLLKKCFYSE